MSEKSSHYCQNFDMTFADCDLVVDTKFTSRHTGYRHQKCAPFYYRLPVHSSNVEDFPLVIKNDQYHWGAVRDCLGWCCI